MISICLEQPTDYAAVFEVNRLAFGRENEARLVEKLRALPRTFAGQEFTPISVIAVEAGQVTGHVLFTPMEVRADSGEVLPALTLAPAAVHPRFQNRGIGSAVIRHGLQLCQQTAAQVITVLGHANYYPRFGFRPASRLGIRPPFPLPDAVFMAMETSPGSLKGQQGLLVYPPEFNEV